MLQPVTGGTAKPRETRWREERPRLPHHESEKQPIESHNPDFRDYWSELSFLRTGSVRLL